MAKVGQEDARYIRRMIRWQRYLMIFGVGLILFGFNPYVWATGIVLLGISRILDNIEIGHNIMHGQYDWMNDPAIHSQSHDWETICCPDSWRRAHNYEHHTYTNILGKDRDFGYGEFRMSADVDWEPRFRWQLPLHGLIAFAFNWGVGAQDLELERINSGEITTESKANEFRIFKQRALRHLLKEYTLLPLLGLLTGVGFFWVALGILLSNTIRNVWVSTVIFCGHFPDDVQTFTIEECENESRGAWYYRQILGSCNFNGGTWMHVMSGHLSMQIEHHLFPDMPSRRYPEVAPKVQAICEQYGVDYHTGNLFTQYFTVLRKLHKFSKPPEDASLTASA